MFKKAMFLTVLATLFSGCASVPMTSETRSEEAKNFDSPPEGQAGVYIFRDSTFGSALKKDIWIDGECVGQSAPLVFFYTTVSGDQQHVISTESEFSPNALDVYTDAGDNYFIRQAIKLGVAVGGAKLEVVEPEQGRAAIQDLDMAKKGTCSGGG